MAAADICSPSSPLLQSLTSSYATAGDHRLCLHNLDARLLPCILPRASFEIAAGTDHVSMLSEGGESSGAH